MISRMTSSGAWLIAMSFMSIGAASAETPIGMLEAQGEIRIDAAESSVVLQDQEYAHFSNDIIQSCA